MVDPNRVKKIMTIRLYQLLHILIDKLIHCLTDH
jgi:hypothetical protein